jgi:hypothetical protein
MSQIPLRSSEDRDREPLRMKRQGTPMLKRSHGPPRMRRLSWVLATLLGVGLVPDARADLSLALSADVGASVEFQGSGTSSTFVFNNSSGSGFHITTSSGIGDSVGLHGTIDGSFTYQKSSISSVFVPYIGLVQSAPVTTVGGLLTITDASHLALTGMVTGVDIETIGTGGTVNVSGDINLKHVIYTGTNADLLQLRNEANEGAGILAITFQFIPSKSLTDLLNGDRTTSYSGSILTQSAPEPSSLVLGCTGALALIGYCRSRGAAHV